MHSTIAINPTLSVKVFKNDIFDTEYAAVECCLDKHRIRSRVLREELGALVKGKLKYISKLAKLYNTEKKCLYK
jgi:hypothetical protein